MTNCTDCRELERQLEEVALEYFQLNSTQGPEDQATKAAQRKDREVQDRFNAHKATHGLMRGSSGA